MSVHEFVRIMPVEKPTIRHIPVKSKPLIYDKTTLKPDVPYLTASGEASSGKTSTAEAFEATAQFDRSVYAGKVYREKLGDTAVDQSHRLSTAIDNEIDTRLTQGLVYAIKNHSSEERARFLGDGHRAGELAARIEQERKAQGLSESRGVRIILTGSEEKRAAMLQSRKKAQGVKISTDEAIAYNAKRQESNTQSWKRRLGGINQYDAEAVLEDGTAVYTHIIDMTKSGSAKETKELVDRSMVKSGHATRVRVWMNESPEETPVWTKETIKTEVRKELKKTHPIRSFFFHVRTLMRS